MKNYLNNTNILRIYPNSKIKCEQNENLFTFLLPFIEKNDKIYSGLTFIIIESHKRR